MLHCDEVASTSESLGSDLEAPNINTSASKSVLYDKPLKKYIKRIDIPHLLFLFQAHSRSGLCTSNLIYIFLKALSQRLSEEKRIIHSLYVVSEANVNHAESGKARKSTFMNKWLLYNFIFQGKDALIERRNQVFNKSAYGTPPCEGFNKFVRLRNNQSIFVKTEENKNSIHDKETNCNAVDVPITIDKHEQFHALLSSEFYYFNPKSRCMGINAIGRENILSEDVVCMLVYGIINTSNWEHGYPFTSWISLYFINNFHYYHPLLVKLFILNVFPLQKTSSEEVIDISRFLCTLKEDLFKYSETDAYHSDIWQYNYYAIKERENGQCYGLTSAGINFVWWHLLDLLVVIRRLSSYYKYSDAPQIIEILVQKLSTLIKQLPFDKETFYILSEFCHRDNTGELVPLLESLETFVSRNLHNLSPMEICSLLQNSNKNNFHSQKLVDSLCNQLITYDLQKLIPADFSQIIATLGKMQIKIDDTTCIDRISTFVMENRSVLKIMNCAQCHAFILGMYRLRYKNAELFSELFQRYIKWAQNGTNKNLNIFIPSLGILSKMYHFDDICDIIKIYKFLSNGFHLITGGTIQQLMVLLARIISSVPHQPKNIQMIDSLILQTDEIFKNCLRNIYSRLYQFSPTQMISMLHAMYITRNRTTRILTPLIMYITGSNLIQPLKEGSSSPYEDDKVIETNIHSYVSLPPCPFDTLECKARLEKLEPMHLVNICISIYGLEFWTPFSLHLLLHIREIIEPQLHDMKSTQIVDLAMSFVDFYFTDYQLSAYKSVENVYKLDNNRRRAQFANSLLNNIQYIVEYNKKCFERIKSMWFSESVTVTDSYSSFDTLNKFQMILKRSQWKEELFLACMEGLQRHRPFIYSSVKLLRKTKILYDLLRFDIYLPEYPYKVPEPLNEKEIPRNIPFLVLEHALERHGSISAALPQIILESQAQLYSISRTESYSNFFNDSASHSEKNQNSDHPNSCDDEEEVQHIGGDAGPENVRNNLIIPNNKPAVITDTLNPSTIEQLETSYTSHRGSGIILEINAVNNLWMYIDPVISGFRISILILEDGIHHIPHLNQSEILNKINTEL
ncbi:hypothetical protein BEWA_007160 [Theileria equi strain WA]|uniref:Uncharacterized protein n=1 Tax=Theileria equi strain WA TaxID=1537102 RepID=L0B0C3_THEEQ|nr:hypothetical protein BEWA_007160 [Theileria equi strain WA]AFZ81307.1 hypothetical protein BEWA_007160 [Theileria equi strain WA]|eukprot:XP_004830973.1 hypothetical protein BEWA_007160 [Theileria equi strain WA]